MTRTILYALVVSMLGITGWAGRQANHDFLSAGNPTGLTVNIKNIPRAPFATGNVFDKAIPHFRASGEKAVKNELAILFLFDVSGSMNDNNKMANARQAAISTLQYICQQAKSTGLVPVIGIMTFSGECLPNPTKKVLDFTSDTVKIRLAILNQLPAPHGNTPTKTAIENADQFLRQRLKISGNCEGNLILLTDGQSTCGGSLRPPGLYSEAKVSKIMVPCDLSGDYLLRYQTIGFDIKPGSEAENDLKYIASTHNGRYFHANDGEELKKAFEKIGRLFVPIEKPQSTTKMKEENNADFMAAVNLINSKNYDTAFSSWKILYLKFPEDSAVMYNYALMCEANEQYKGAIANYEKYLRQNPFVPTRPAIEEAIKKLRLYYPDHFVYQKQVMKSDINFVDDYVKRLDNGQNIPVASEFTGFIKEKSTFYETLPNTLGVEEPQVQVLSKGVVTALKNVQRVMTNTSTDWDQNAKPLIWLIYQKMTKLNDLISSLELR